MDSETQTAAYAAADFNESNTLFARLFAESFPDCPQTGAMADLGCGPGDITLRMARAYPGWQVTGLDAGKNMLRHARERLSRDSGPVNVTFRHSYLPDDSLKTGAWDALISNSLLHHLPDPTGAVAEHQGSRATRGRGVGHGLVPAAERWRRARAGRAIRRRRAGRASR